MLFTEAVVKKLMTLKVITVAEGEPAKRALELMTEYDIGAIVVTSNGRPAGIITERDIVKRIAREELNLSTPVGDMMSKPLITVEPETRLTEALNTMVRHNIRRLPVMKNGRLSGIVVERDIIRWLIERPEIILDLLSTTEPNAVKEVFIALARELKLKDKIRI